MNFDFATLRGVSLAKREECKLIATSSNDNPGLGKEECDATKRILNLHHMECKINKLVKNHYVFFIQEEILKLLHPHKPPW